MAKQYSIFFILILLLSNATKAMEATDENNETLEEQFKKLELTNSDDHECKSLRFNKFVATQAYLLLDEPDNIEALNLQIKESSESLANHPNSYKIGSDLHTKIERSNKKHKELFDFVRKYQDTYTVNPEMLEDLQILKAFIEPIKSTIGIYHKGKPLTVEEYFSLENLEPADRDNTRIALFEKTANIRWAFDNLPSEQAIKELPASIQKFKTLQEYYTQFIRDYPNHEQRAEYENKLACSQKLFETFPKEYLKPQPSKSEIEHISVASFLKNIGYTTIQERFDKLQELQDPEEQKSGIKKIEDIATALKEYTEKYPTLDPNLSGTLHKAANRLNEVVAEFLSDK